MLGETIRELVHQAGQEKLPKLNADFDPLDGEPENINNEYHVNTLCYQLARAFTSQCHYIYAPAITRTAEIRQAIVHDVNYEKISAFWEKLDIGIVSIGVQVICSSIFVKKFPGTKFCAFNR